MRSKLITVVTAVASIVLVTQVAAADQVQEQLRLMEQRMAEMEDRLQATSDELRTAKDTVSEQQDLLTDAGLIDEDGDSGLRSRVGSFFDMVDISGVVAAGFNYRLEESSIDTDDGAGLPGGNPYFKNPDANTFTFDQFWVSLDKTPTEESRGGFHAELFTGQVATGQAQGDSNDVGNPYLYSAYVSYLAPIGNGIQIDAGRLATPLGAEVVQTNGNYFITQGAVFGLQPVTHTGVSFSTQITDEVGFIFGVVNEVYSDTFTSSDNDKAYYGQFQFAGDSWGINVGGIIGDDSANGACSGAECQTSVVDVTMTADPTENLSLWANFDWAHSGGEDFAGNGDTFGVSVAGRLGVTEKAGIATRFEYINTQQSIAGTNDNPELITLTGTGDYELADGLVTRLEVRWDHSLDSDDLAFNGGATGGQASNVTALWQMYYEF